MNEKKTSKQTKIKWVYSLFTMRKEGQSFYKALLEQKQKQLID